MGRTKRLGNVRRTFQRQEVTLANVETLVMEGKKGGKDRSDWSEGEKEGI